MIMHALVIGHADRAEMQPIMSWLAARVSTGDLLELAQCQLAADPGTHPDLVVVLESWPDEYSTRDVQALFARFPSSRIVCCAGSWSEASGRTRGIWPLAVRVPAISALTRLDHEWRLLNSEAAPLLPATGSREERFAAHHPALATSTCIGLRVRIHSPDTAWRQMLTDVLGMAGLTVVHTASESAEVQLLDADPWHASRTGELCRLAAQVPVVAVSGWITPELARAMQQAGAAAVVPKAGDIHQLIQAIQRAATGENSGPCQDRDLAG